MLDYVQKGTNKYKKGQQSLLVTVFENYSKCLIQNCERSELCLHGQKLVETIILSGFSKPKA